jgi:uncharacterized membrane protein
LPAAEKPNRWREGLKWGLVALYGVAGVAHLKSPAGFQSIVPSWVPFPHEVVLGTGVAELLGAAGLLVPSLRRSAGIGLAAYAVAVYPANIKHMVDNVAISGVTLGLGYHIPRLMLQPLLVWAALYAGGVIDWPFKRKARP